MKSLYRKILCPTDLSPVGEHAVSVAYGLAGPGTIVHLLHVSEPVVLAGSPPPLLQGDSPGARAAREKRLQEKLRWLLPDDAAAEGVRTEVLVFHDTDVAARVVAEAERLGVDAIVMGSHGQTGFGRILMGSVAMDVVRRATVPVILVHDRRSR